MFNSYSYDDFQRSLAAANALSEPAEAHGALTGGLCALVPYRLEDWLAEVLPDGAALTADTVLSALYDSTVAALADADMAFDLLLPEDDQSIGERTRALALWCSGFLYGLGVSGAADPRTLPGDLGEVLRDLTEISRADVDADASAETNETALMELVEFVRVGVQTVFEELGPLRERGMPRRRQLH